jgi:hypothetical protein
MSSLTKEEYLALINELLERQYEEDKSTSTEPENHWIPAEPAIKEKLPFAVRGGILDLSNASKEKIRVLAFQSDTFKVDHFLIRVKRPPKIPKAPQIKSTLTIDVLEEKFRTPSGAPCRIEYKVNFPKDSRFNNFAHVAKFQSNGRAINVSEDVFFDLIRWLQAIKRMTAFL